MDYFQKPPHFRYYLFLFAHFRYFKNFFPLFPPFSELFFSFCI